MALLADDGEKFGVWPDTHHQVYEKGWLDQFFTLLEQNADWLKVALPGQVRDRLDRQEFHLALEAVMAEVLRVARPNSVLYTEIPVEMYHPPITHLQDFKLGELMDRFRNFRSHHKTFELVRSADQVPDQFTFRVVDFSFV